MLFEVNEQALVHGSRAVCLAINNTENTQGRKCLKMFTKLEKWTCLKYMPRIAKKCKEMTRSYEAFIKSYQAFFWKLLTLFKEHVVNCCLPLNMSAMTQSGL